VGPAEWLRCLCNGDCPVHVSLVLHQVFANGAGGNQVDAGRIALRRCLRRAVPAAISVASAQQRREPAAEQVPGRIVEKA
jgi:hypothetical protein